MKSPKLTRRQFLKASAAAAAVVALSKSVFNWPWQPLLTRAEAQADSTEEWVATTCWVGKQDCGMLARVIDGRVAKLEGHPDHPRNRGTLCPKGQAQILALYDPYRVKAPLKRTNDKGVPGEWTEISWDEALTLVGDKIKELRERDPGLILWQKGRSKAKDFYDDAFVKASGATKMGHGAYCSDAGYRAMEYTVGRHGVLHPDFRYCNYLLNWGWNVTNAGGNKLCWITWPRELADARERGMKVVTLDPWRRGAGPHTDEWLPNRPGSDLAFFLALAYVLIDKGYLDQDYLKNHTNAPFLVKEDGYFYKVADKEQVWDTTTSSAQDYDAAGVTPELDGEHTVGGETVKTAYRLFKEHVAQYTPEWAAGICGLEASTIRDIGEELGQNARIGSTITLDGVELTYRPVAAMGYHVTQQELGFQACRAAAIVFMLLGAIEAVGGLRSDFKKKLHGNFTALDGITVKDKPDSIYLKNSKFFPINSANPAVAALAMLYPARYEVEDYVPEVLILHMANPLLSFPPQDVFFVAYKKFNFVAAIDPWMSETADYFADVVLPACTMEKYEGPYGVTDQYEDATTLRMPLISPLYQSRGDIDIYIDLCEKAGILYGSGGYIDKLNSELKLTDNPLDLNERPTVKDIFDRWARQEGYTDGIAYFEQHGVEVTSIAASDLYVNTSSADAYGGIRHRLYGESLKRLQDDMKQKWADDPAGEIYWSDYTPLPTWRSPTMEQSPAEYDLYLINHKKIEYKQSRSTFFPLLNELEPEQGVEINPSAAMARGIGDGDEVWVESYNAVTDETKRVKAKAKYVEGIRLDTVSMSHHYGFWVHPWAKGKGPTGNAIFFSGEGYVANTADQSFQVKVKVFKA